MAMVIVLEQKQEKLSTMLLAQDLAVATQEDAQQEQVEAEVTVLVLVKRLDGQEIPWLKAILFVAYSGLQSGVSDPLLGQLLEPRVALIAQESFIQSFLEPILEPEPRQWALDEVNMLNLVKINRLVVILIYPSFKLTIKLIVGLSKQLPMELAVH